MIADRSYDEGMNVKNDCGKRNDTDHPRNGANMQDKHMLGFKLHLAPLIVTEDSDEENGVILSHYISSNRVLAT